MGKRSAGETMVIFWGQWGLDRGRSAGFWASGEALAGPDGQ